MINNIIIGFEKNLNIKVLNWFENEYDWDYYRVMRIINEEYENSNINYRYQFYKQIEKDSKIFEEMLLNKVWSISNEINLVINPYQIYYDKETTKKLISKNKIFNIYKNSLKKFKNKEIDFYKDSFSGDLCIFKNFETLDKKFNFHGNIVRWLGAFGFHSDFEEVLKFEFSSIREKAGELISIGKKNNLDIDPFLSGKSNLNTGIGLLYNTEDIYELFNSDVWSVISKYGKIIPTRNEGDQYDYRWDNLTALEYFTQCDWSHTEAIIKKDSIPKGIYLSGNGIKKLKQIKLFLERNNINIDIFIDTKKDDFKNKIQNYNRGKVLNFKNKEFIEENFNHEDLIVKEYYSEYNYDNYEKSFFDENILN